MRKILAPLNHAFFLLRRLGLQRTGIVLIYWVLRRYRPIVGPIFQRNLQSPKREHISKDPVLVYQMSKVGSTSLLYSIQFAYAKAGLPKVNIHHAHTLTNLDLHEQNVRLANGSAQQIALVEEYRQIRKAIEAQPDEHWMIVSLVRDPVARQVSDFFHHIDRHLPDWRSRWRDGSLAIDQVIESFLTVVDATQHWFEGEIQGFLGIDVYATPFPHEKGYGLYSRPPKISLLVIRLEDLDRVAATAIDEFLGLKNFKLHSFNLGTDSEYGEIYRQFKTKPLPKWYLEQKYTGRMASHFYTRAELEKFAQKWSREKVIDA